jgi:hypothetical protein
MAPPLLRFIPFLAITIIIIIIIIIIIAEYWSEHCA